MITKITDYLKKDNLYEKISENVIGYTAKPNDKIYIKPSELSKFNNGEFISTNGTCVVTTYNYRNRPNPFVYVIVNIKSKDYSSAWIEDLNEISMLAADLEECKAFIEKLEKA